MCLTDAHTLLLVRMINPAQHDVFTQPEINFGACRASIWWQHHQPHWNHPLACTWLWNPGNVSILSRATYSCYSSVMLQQLQ